MENLKNVAPLNDFNWDAYEHGEAETSMSHEELEKAYDGTLNKVCDHEVVDGLDDEPQDAADDEDPEQVEEVELDVALALEVAAKHVNARCLAVNHVAELALDGALPMQTA